MMSNTTTITHRTSFLPLPPFSIISPEWKTFHRLITLSCYIFQPGTVLFISFNDAKLKWIGETG